MNREIRSTQATSRTLQNMRFQYGYSLLTYEMVSGKGRREITNTDALLIKVTGLRKRISKAMIKY